MPAYSSETRNPTNAHKDATSRALSGPSPFANFHAIAKTVRNLQEAIGLTGKESLILKYLIVNPGAYIDARQISALVFGIFDGNPGPAAVQEHICGIRSKYVSEFGFDPIRFDPERGYMVAGMRSAIECDADEAR